jgi:hypothetical protein
VLVVQEDKKKEVNVNKISNPITSQLHILLELIIIHLIITFLYNQTHLQSYSCFYETLYLCKAVSDEGLQFLAGYSEDPPSSYAVFYQFAK